MEEKGGLVCYKMLLSAGKTQRACEILDNICHVPIAVTQPTESLQNDGHFEVAVEFILSLSSIS